ncbi:MAG: CARDB domain-containing protein [Minisyncoccia bacterium]
MEQPYQNGHTYETRQAAVNALAVVGFVALVFVGITLAIYAARYVPIAISRVSSFFTIASVGNHNNLSVISSTTIPFQPASTTPTFAVATSTVATTTKPAKPVVKNPPVAGYTTVTTAYPTPGSVKIPQNNTTLYGLPNLAVTITAVGYIDDNGNFVADKTITDDQELAAKILVTNTGTNNSGEWDIKVIVPTKTDSTFEEDSSQASLAPSQSNEITLRLTRGRPRVGDNEEIVVEVDPDHRITETNESDNDFTALIDVEKD